MFRQQLYITHTTTSVVYEKEGTKSGGGEVVEEGVKIAGDG